MSEASYWLEPEPEPPPAPEWYKDFSNVLKLARDLVEECEIADCETLIYFFSKPWKWTEEWEGLMEEERWLADKPF